MGYWETKVVPKIKKIFEKNGTKKAAVEACKSFDETKEGINKEFEEKKAELQPKVLEIYEASPTPIKILVKEHKEAGLKKHSTVVNKFLEELNKIEFPGSKAVSEASSKFGPQMVSGPVFFVFEKVSSFIVEAPAPVEQKDVEASASEVTNTEKDKELVVEEEKKEEEAAKEEAGKSVTSEAAPAATEPEKKEDLDAPKTT